MWAYCHNAINDGVYNISERLQKSKIDLIESIKNSAHAALISEIKFSSPSLGSIRDLSDPVEIAKMMINGGAVGLSILTQPYLFNGSPEIFMQIRRHVDVPLLMKDIIVDKTQIDGNQSHEINKRRNALLGSLPGYLCNFYRPAHFIQRNFTPEYPAKSLNFRIKRDKGA